MRESKLRWCDASALLGGSRLPCEGWAESGSGRVRGGRTIRQTMAGRKAKVLNNGATCLEADGDGHLASIPDAPLPGLLLHQIYSSEADGEEDILYS